MLAGKYKFPFPLPARTFFLGSTHLVFYTKICITTHKALLAKMISGILPLPIEPLIIGGFI
jgi:hypothetical protein